jgi:hypothetical protein
LLQPTERVPEVKDLWLNWFAIKGQEEFARACQRWSGNKVRSTVLERPELVRRFEVPRGFEAAIGSKQAGLMGWSPWPCTDIGLAVPKLKPAETGTFEGHVELRVR